MKQKINENYKIIELAGKFIKKIFLFQEPFNGVTKEFRGWLIDMTNQILFLLIIL